MRFKKIIIALLLIISIAAADSLGGYFDSAPVIVLCAFGTSTSAIETYDFIDKEIRRALPGYELRWAFTSQFIVDKLGSQSNPPKADGDIAPKADFGRYALTLSEVYRDLKKEGRVNVVVQSLHIGQGAEFREMLCTPSEGLNLRYGLPLLSADDDYRKVLKALKANFIPEKEGINVVVAHGNDRHPEYNYSIVKLDKMLRQIYPNVVIGSVEGMPGPAGAIENAINYRYGNKVNFIPCMIVSGDHIENDIMGDKEADGEKSWKLRIGKDASLQRSLGFNKKIISIFVEHIKSALEQF